MGNWMQAWWAAWSFLTVLPVPHACQAPAEALRRGVVLFPWVGLGLGLIHLALTWMLLPYLPAPVLAALVLGVATALTGALHLDGLMDVADGLLGGRSPEERLRIMRDECTGAFGVLATVLVLLLRFAALAELLPPGRLPGLWTAALVLPPTLGRMAMGLALALYPYAREQGLGTPWKQSLGGREALALLVGAGLAAAAFGPPGLLLWGSAGVATHLFARWVMTRIPGFTGDVYGALNELVETLSLLLLVVWL